MGIKEFESGLDQITSYLIAANRKTVITNTDCSKYSDTTDEGSFCNHISSSEIITTVENIKIGVVGFVNPIANQISDAGKLIFGVPRSVLIHNF